MTRCCVVVTAPHRDVTVRVVRRAKLATRVSIWFLASAMLSACSSAPSDGLVSDVVTKKLGDAVRVENFKRINGIAMPGGNGVAEQYNVQFEATVIAVVPATLRISSGFESGVLGKLRLKDVVRGHEPDRQGLAMLFDITTKVWRIDPGGRVDITGAVQFVKTEKGWQAQTVETAIADSTVQEMQRVVRITTLVTARGIENNEPAGQTQHFEGAPTVVAILATYADTRSGDVIRLSISSGNNEVVAHETKVANQSGTISALFQGIIGGDYIVRAIANGKPANETHFRVSPTGPLTLTDLITARSEQDGRPIGPTTDFEAGTRTIQVVAIHRNGSIGESLLFRRWKHDSPQSIDCYVRLVRERASCGFALSGNGRYTVEVLAHERVIGTQIITVGETR